MKLSRSAARLLQSAIVGLSVSLLLMIALHASPQAFAQRDRGAQKGALDAVQLFVNASDIQRGLLRSVMQIPVDPGPLDLYYVEWSPGNHNPSGPIQNVVDFFVRDAAGNLLDWRRDPTHVHRVSVTVPPNSPTIIVEMAYIANQPSVTSRSTDSYGHARYGGMNWNTVLVYPGKTDKDALMYDAKLLAPEGWILATSLDAKQAGPMQGPRGTIAFERVSLAELVDSPVILSSSVRTYELGDYPSALGGRAPHAVHLAARNDELTELPEERLEKFRAVCEQAGHIFGPFPYDEFHFLLLAGDELPGFGVEHTQSTYVSMEEDEMDDPERPGGDPMTVIPHEYIHCWNGKLRAPADLLHDNYHTPGHTQLMWVYEGLTTYYTDVLAARAGLLDEEAFHHRLARRIRGYELQAGRRWRSVEDTAAGLRFLRGGSRFWGDLRRRQDYYSEGALFWMECDAIIRRGTEGGKSLDDFCKLFFDVRFEHVGSPIEYTRTDVVDGLTSIYAGHDWEALIRERIETPAHELSISLPQTLGYLLEDSREPTKLQEADVIKEKGANLRNSIGLSVDEDGMVTSIVPQSVADRARLGYGMKIVTVNSNVFSPDALRDGVQESPSTGAIDLLVSIDGETTQTFTLEYAQGHIYPRLARESDDDLIGEIIAPR